MGDTRFIKTLRLRDFLSYGPNAEAIELGALNVLIGPNASGKSNLIEAIGLLALVPRDLATPIRKGGGMEEWIWKGAGTSGVAELETTVAYPDGIVPLRYRLRLASVAQRIEVVDEAIENEARTSEREKDVDFFYRFQNGRPVLNYRPPLDSAGKPGTEEGRTKRSLRREDLSPEQSVLSQRKDPDQLPELTYLGNKFTAIRLFREWNLGRYTSPRLPQKTDLPADFLLEDASNLALVINDLQHRKSSKQVLLKYLKQFYEEAEDITTKLHSQTVQMFVDEQGLAAPIPATRLSDGTLRYLCLLTILCHPTPPPLVCIEEPELGLHPDILPSLGDLLLEASQRTQLVVTTHSDVLVSALTQAPDAILVCERDQDGSHLRRLRTDDLKDWLSKYSLGELWRMGEIGGTRW